MGKRHFGDAGLRVVLVYVVAVPVHLLPFLSGCAPSYKVPVRHYTGEYEYLAEHEGKAADGRAPRRDRSLHRLHAATALMAAGNVDAAKLIYSEACAEMFTFQPDGEWKAVAIEESAKDYRGDPYEQLIAYFILGLLSYRAGDMEDAQAHFKTALLADTGSTEERYRSDSAMSWLFLGKALQRLGDMEAGRESILRASHIPWSRWAVPAVSAAVHRGTCQVAEDFNMQQKDGQWLAELKVATLCLLDAISAGASAQATPTEVFIAVRRDALARLNEITTSKDHETRQKLDGQNPARVEAWLELICDRAFFGPLTHTVVNKDILGGYGEPIVREDTPEKRAACAAEAEVIEKLAAPENTLTVVTLLGPGPRKYSEGKHNEVLRYDRNPVPVLACTTSYQGGGASGKLISRKLEDVGFQAATRGGRQIEAILRGKALFKDAMVSTSAVTFVVATAAVAAAAMAATTVVTTTTYTTASGAVVTATSSTVVFPPALIAVAGAALIVFLVTALAASATNPAADTRYWENIPGEFYVASAEVPPGVYTVDVDCEMYCSMTFRELLKRYGIVLNKHHPSYGLLDNNALYGCLIEDVEVKPGYETVVIINAGPYIEGTAARPVPTVGFVPLTPATGGQWAAFDETDRMVDQD